jgi:hypothetical protein
MGASPPTRRAQLSVGGRASETIRIPDEQLAGLFATVVRQVADLPQGAERVVWQLGESELEVHTVGTRLTCSAGIVAVTIPVSCEQLPAPAIVRVAFAVGRPDRPAGLVMATTTRPTGPDVVTARWSDALIAFAHECVLRLAEDIAAQAGDDKSGRALIPGAVSAVQGVLLVTPMARHTIRWSEL